MYIGRTAENKVIYDIINTRHSYRDLKTMLQREGNLPNDSLLEVVALQNLYSEFYSNRFSRQGLLEVLEELISDTRVERYREIGQQMRAKLTHLLAGFAPPAFSLCNQDSVPVSLDHYRGKYVYLMFCTTQNYVCFKQYDVMKDLYDIHRRWLQFVVISADDSFAHMRDFRKRNGYQWDFLHTARQSSVVHDYDVRAFPAAFLIDPDGKLVAAPAPEATLLEHYLYVELNRKGLWNDYLRKGWIDAKKLQEFRNSDPSEKNHH
jgi:peroxiredoxin